MKPLLALVAVLLLAGCGPSPEEECSAMGGDRVVDKTSTGVSPVVNGQGGVAVTVSTTYYCLTSDGRVVGVF